MCVRPLPSLTLLRPSQYANAPFVHTVTESGIVTDGIESQFLKQYSPIHETPFGSESAWRLVQLRNAPVPSVRTAVPANVSFSSCVSL